MCHPIFFNSKLAAKATKSTEVSTQHSRTTGTRDHQSHHCRRRSEHTECRHGSARKRVPTSVRGALRAKNSSPSETPEHSQSVRQSVRQTDRRCGMQGAAQSERQVRETDETCRKKKSGSPLFGPYSDRCCCIGGGNSATVGRVGWVEGCDRLECSIPGKQVWSSSMTPSISPQAYTVEARLSTHMVFR